MEAAYDYDCIISTSLDNLFLGSIIKILPLNKMNFNGLKSMITDFSFGKIVVNGRTYTDDIKIVRGQVISNWWRKSGHRVDIEDVADILDSNPEIVVIGKGSPGLMKTSASLRERLATHNIGLIEKKTSRAIEVFNTLFQEGESVAAGFHVGC